jgi:DNA-binding transcriptional ArsR family regulator
LFEVFLYEVIFKRLRIKPTMNNPTRERAGQLFAALGNTTRLRIVELLITGERTVNDVAAALNLQQSSASQHLAVLTRAGILHMVPRGTARIYSVRGPRIAHILALIEEFCDIHQLYGVDEEPEPAAHPPAA